MTDSDNSPAQQDLQTQLNALFSAYDRRDRPGAIAGVAYRGRTIYRAAFGQANIEHAVEMTATTRVSICSVTKHMTCAAVLKLADEGLLSLDDSIGRWVPELQAATGAPTLHQLMNHTGGVRCHLDIAAFNGVLPNPVGTAMRMMGRQRTVNFEPGDGTMYCNGGYVLLSIAIERASKRPFGRYLEEEFFAPLRMDASASPRTWWPLPQNLATYYLPDVSGGWRHGIGFEEEPFGNGSVVSSIDDMLRWCQFLREDSGPTSLAALTASPAGADVYTQGVYRYGLTDEFWRGVRVVEHGGGAVGASCHLLIAPEEELDIFVFFNGMEPAQQIARQIAAIVLAERVEPEPPAEPIASADYQSMLGQFIDDEQGLVIGFSDLDGQLGISMFGGPAVPFLQRHQPRVGELPFHLPTAIGPRFLRLSPDSGALQWLDGGRWRSLRSIELSAPPLDAMLQGLGDGEFVSDEAGATLRFGEEEGGLLMHSCGEFGVWKFYPQLLSRDMFAFGFYKGSAGWLARMTWDGDQVTQLEMSSTRTRGLVFMRS